MKLRILSLISVALMSANIAISAASNLSSSSLSSSSRAPIAHRSKTRAEMRAEQKNKTTFDKLIQVAKKHKTVAVITSALGLCVVAVGGWFFLPVFLGKIRKAKDAAIPTLTAELNAQLEALEKEFPAAATGASPAVAANTAEAVTAANSTAPAAQSAPEVSVVAVAVEQPVVPMAAGDMPAAAPAIVIEQEEAAVPAVDNQPVEPAPVLAEAVEAPAIEVAIAEQPAVEPAAAVNLAVDAVENQ